MQNEAEVVLVLFLPFPATSTQQNRSRSLGKVQRVENLRDSLLTMPNFQNLVHCELMYQNHRNNENLEEICVKVVNQHLYTTHTKYEPKQTNTKVVWCIHGENLGLDPLTLEGGDTSPRGSCAVSIADWEVDGGGARAAPRT